MADGQHGGYRRPANPAPVSGPGALSRRTDGGVPKMDVTGQSYGENGAINELQSAAPLSSPSLGGGGGGGAPMGPTPPTSLMDPSANPGEPVTSGADFGAGPSSADIGLKQDRDREIRQALGPMAPVFMRMADSPYATPSYKRQVRQLLARIT